MHLGITGELIEEIPTMLLCEGLQASHMYVSDENM